MKNALKALLQTDQLTDRHSGLQRRMHATKNVVFSTKDQKEKKRLFDLKNVCKRRIPSRIIFFCISEFFQGVLILVQIAIFVLIFFLLRTWQPPNDLPVKVIAIRCQPSHYYADTYVSFTEEDEISN